MPGFDGTGPLGRGPLTGRGRGYCVVKLPDGHSSLPCGDSNNRNGIRAQSLDESRNKSAGMVAASQAGPPGQGTVTGASAGLRSSQQAPGLVIPVVARCRRGTLPFAPVTHPVIPPFCLWLDHGRAWG